MGLNERERKNPEVLLGEEAEEEEEEINGLSVWERKREREVVKEADKVSPAR